MYAKFENIWDSMKNNQLMEKGEYLIKRRLNPESPFDIFLAMEKPEDIRMLLLSISHSNIPDLDSLPESKGFKLNLISREEGSKDHVNLELTLIDSEYSDIFSSLIKDITENIDDEKDEKKMIEAFIERIVKWQLFLDKYGNEGLGNNAQRGLYGELWFLKKYLIPSIGQKKAIDAWKGPYRKAQDFQFSGCAIEVKTNNKKQHQNIRISSERQLDDTGFEKLFLHCLSVTESTDINGETLYGIITDIRRMISSNFSIAQKFENLLNNAGYIEPHSNLYNKTSYAIRSSNIFEVEGNFPRIVEKDLLNGVGDVSYSISLAECKHYLVNEIDFKKVIEDFV